MSTRALVGYASPDGTWRAVWNHWSGQTQHLGRWIIREVGKLGGDLAGFCARYVDACPQGWSSLASGERAEDDDDPTGFLTGQFDGVIARCDGEACFDAHYLYLFWLPKRRLYVFTIDEGPLRPFGMVTFDERGQATPKKLPPVEE
jgi:hypothetical protein